MNYKIVKVFMQLNTNWFLDTVNVVYEPIRNQQEKYFVHALIFENSKYHSSDQLLQVSGKNDSISDFTAYFDNYLP